jgi:NhaP-type Na+/H+ or K+/H+ antiporter
MYADLTIIGLFVFVYSAVPGGVERAPITGPIVLTAFGMALGPVGLGWLSLDVELEGLRALAELTLALVLFTDAANAHLTVLGKSWRTPERLLLIGLPLTILLGVGVGVVLFPGLGPLEIAILATMLAPTDAALGKAVVTNKAVPTGVREGLSVESGLNDGICVPMRMLPVYLSLGGLPLRRNAKLFIGWFGPRGLASIVFGIMVLDAGLPGGGTLAVTVVCTIVLSILLHGVTANPLVARFARSWHRPEEIQ